MVDRDEERADGQRPGQPVERFGAVLKRWRVERGLSQEELAASARLHVRTVQDLERGKSRSAQPANARRMADALDLTPHDRDEFLTAAGAARTSGRGAGPAAQHADAAARGGSALPQRTRPRHLRLVMALTVTALVVGVSAALYRTYGPAPLPPLGQPIVLESVNFPGCFVQAQGQEVVLRGADSAAALERSTFLVVPGLAGDEGVSLRLADPSDQYLRVVDRSVLLQGRDDADERFDEEATFRMEPGLALGADRGVSFRSWEHSGLYLRHWMSTFFVEGPDQDKHTGTPFERDSTFYWHSPEPAATACAAL